MAAGLEFPAMGFDRANIGARIDTQRRRAILLVDAEAGTLAAQDGLISALAVSSAVSGALHDRLFTLVAAIAAALVGAVSTTSREYRSRRIQRAIALAEIARERERIAVRGSDVQSEMAYVLGEDGLPEDEASIVAAMLARHREVLLKAKVEKQFGIAIEEAEGSPLRRATILGVAFGMGAVVPILPFLALPLDWAVTASIVATAGVLFAIELVKTRWTHRKSLASALAVLVSGALAGVISYVLGSSLSSILGAPSAGAR
jgi:VIT1/CCC1 family predicted Fe2+/Mn2+ transporter